MKKILLILVVSLSIGNSAFAKDNTEIFVKQIEILQKKLESDGKKSQACKDFVNMNIQLIEASIHKKIGKAKEKLVKYENDLENCSDFEYDQKLDKMRKIEKNLQTLQEVLLKIELLKIEMGTV